MIGNLGGKSLVIYTGENIVIENDNKQVKVLPPGVGPSVKRVYKEYVMDRMVEVMAVEFQNGHYASLEIHISEPSICSVDALEEFRARCLMIHDL